MLITEKQIREIIRKNLIKEKSILLETNAQPTNSGATTYTHDILVGNEHSNKFIRKHFDSVQVELSKEYLDNTNNKMSVVNIKYADLEKKDIDKITACFTEKLSGVLAIDISIMTKISNILMRHDQDKKSTVFDIFTSDFPIQKYPCTNADSIETLGKYIAGKTTDSLFQDLYSYHESSSTFNTGKGEYLCVLLTKDGKSGGTKALDVIVGGSNFEYDLKQITDKSSSLKFTLSTKSGMKSYKSAFIETYKKIGKKAYDLKDEFLKLGVDKDIIDAIDQFAGDVGSSFKKDAAYIKIFKKQQDASSLAFGDLNDAFIHAIKAMRRRTYVNVTEMQNDVAGKFQQSGIKPDSFDTSTLSISNKITKEEAKNLNKTNKKTQGSGYAPITQAAANFTYTPQDKIRNMDEDTFNKLNDIYDLELKAFNDFEESEIWAKYKNLIVQPDLNVNFWKIDVSLYNQSLAAITEPGVSKYFELNEKYSPIILPRAATHFVSGSNTETIIDNIKTEDSLQKKLDIIKKIAAINITSSSGSFSYTTKIKPALENIFNMQVILTDDQMQKINSIIEEVKNYGNVSSVNKISKIKDEYLIVEPLQQDPNEGEFVIDVSFYKNKRKRHIDTLHSKDFEIKNGGTIKKAGKEAEITRSAAVEKQLDITLTEVISDKDEINKKLKEFNLFNTLQPVTLEKIFKNKNKSVASTKDFEIEKIQKGSLDYSDIEVEEEFDFNSQSATEFVKQLKDLKEKTNEDNIINMLYDLYISCDEIEKNIKNYYAGKNQVMVMKDNDSDVYTDAYSWTKSILKHNSYTDKKGFMLGLAEDGILCQADPDKYVTQRTIKDDIYVLLNEIYKLTLEIQSLSRT